MPASTAVDTRADLAVAGAVVAWLTVVLTLDRGGVGLQRLFGLATWVLLAGLLRLEGPLVRAQVGIVVVLGTAVEYIAAPLLGICTGSATCRVRAARPRPALPHGARLDVAGARPHGLDRHR